MLSRFLSSKNAHFEFFFSSFSSFLSWVPALNSVMLCFLGFSRKNVISCVLRHNRVMVTNVMWLNHC